MYHGESQQEDFLVLAGECVLVVEGEERRLRAWDFVHCPPGTEHVFVGAGDGPCVIFMTGARTGERQIVYPRSEPALRHGAGVESETTSPNEAYERYPHWQPERPTPTSGPNCRGRSSSRNLTTRTRRGFAAPSRPPTEATTLNRRSSTRAKCEALCAINGLLRGAPRRRRRRA